MIYKVLSHLLVDSIWTMDILASIFSFKTEALVTLHQDFYKAIMSQSWADSLSWVPSFLYQLSDRTNFAHLSYLLSSYSHLDLLIPNVISFHSFLSCEH